MIPMTTKANPPRGGDAKPGARQGGPATERADITMYTASSTPRPTDLGRASEATVSVSGLVAARWAAAGTIALTDARRSHGPLAPTTEPHLLGNVPTQMR